MATSSTPSSSLSLADDLLTTAEDRARILKLAGEVRGGDWGQIWEDPGDYPSNAGGRALRPEFCRSDAPDELASWVKDLLADFDTLSRSPGRDAVIEECAQVADAEVWRPIASAPRDGTAIWAYLYQTGIRQVRWVSAEEAADEEGGLPDLYEAGFYEVDDPDEGWSPRWWLPLNEIAVPSPPAQGGRRAMARFTTHARLDTVRREAIMLAGWEGDRALRDDLGSSEQATWEIGYCARHPEHVHAYASLVKGKHDSGTWTPYIEAFRAKMTSAAATVSEAEVEAVREAASHARTIIDRDAAEDALSEAYRIITGNDPQWSNAFGYRDALNEIKDAAPPTDARRSAFENGIAEAITWHEARDKELSKQPPGGDRQWRRMEHQDEIVRLRALAEPAQ